MRYLGIGVMAVVWFSAAGAVYAQTSDSTPAPAPSSAAAAAPDTGPSSNAGDALNKFSLSTGASAWTGDYGAKSHTDIAAVLLGARYNLGDLRLTASVPWMRIDTAGAFFTGIDGTPLVVAPSTSTTPVHKVVHDGVGDLTLGASYLVPYANPLGIDLELTGRVKLPTASRESGLSTGKTDYSLGGEVSKTIAKFGPFASITYRSFGDTAQWKLKDGVATSLGTTYLISNNLIAVVSYDYAQRTSAFIRDDHEVVTSASYSIPNTRLRLSAYTSYGLSTGAAAFSGGLSLSVKL